MAPIGAEETVEKGDGGGFAIGAGNAYKFETARRVTVEVVGHDTQCNVAVLDLDIRHSRRQLVGQLATHHGGGTLGNGRADKLMAVNTGATLCHKTASRLHFARVEADAVDVGVATHVFYYERFFSAKKGCQFHGFSSITTVAPFLMGVRGLGDCETTLPWPRSLVLSPAL